MISPSTKGLLCKTQFYQFFSLLPIFDSMSFSCSAATSKFADLHSVLKKDVSLSQGKKENRQKKVIFMSQFNAKTNIRQIYILKHCSSLLGFCLNEV